MVRFPILAVKDPTSFMSLSFRPKSSRRAVEQSATSKLATSGQQITSETRCSLLWAWSLLDGRPKRREMRVGADEGERVWHRRAVYTLHSITQVYAVDPIHTFTLF
jgi:hypothetical protein